MVPKFKKLLKKAVKSLRKNKGIIALGILFLILLVVALFSYKIWLYSNDESDIYDIRLLDIKNNEFSMYDRMTINEKVAESENIFDSEIYVKGRLIKVFITFKKDTNDDVMKKEFNNVLTYLDEKVLGYYDISFYAIKLVDKKEIYPLTGYKHKNNYTITFEELNIEGEFR